VRPENQKLRTTVLDKLILLLEHSLLLWNPNCRYGIKKYESSHVNLTCILDSKLIKYYNCARTVPGKQFPGNDINESSGDFGAGIYERE
jgi:hypothetical protein